MISVCHGPKGMQNAGDGEDDVQVFIIQGAMDLLWFTCCFPVGYRMDIRYAGYDPVGARR